MIVGSRHWLLILLVWVVAITTWPRTASAQATLAMSKDYPVKRIDDDTGRTVSSGTDQTVALTITGADCRSKKLKLQFNLTVTGYDNSQVLQAWAGRSADCAAEYTSSTAALTRACWQLEDSITVSNGVATVEIAPSLLLGIGVPSQFAGNQRPLTESCDQPFTQNARLNITVYFLLINTEGKVATNTTQGMYFLLSGPTAPDIKQLISADQALELKWAALTSSTTELTYQFYCAPNEAGEGDCKSSVLERLGS
ncbi:MAG TPA: hypothetical protein VKP30_28290, partial [Polyangiaceae bacterium]|nr:hypothetical protein [Polyangiaceae bacterium]